jgi:hypothetical protein
MPTIEERETIDDQIRKDYKKQWGDIGHEVVEATHTMMQNLKKMSQSGKLKKFIEECEKEFRKDEREHQDSFPTKEQMETRMTL